MSVFLENHRRGSDPETDASFGRSNARRRHANGRPVTPRLREETPLWGFSYDRAESLIHLLLAFTMVGGAAAVIWHFAAPEADKPAPPPAVAARPAPVPSSALAQKPAAPTAPALAKVGSAKPAEPAPQRAAPAPLPVTTPAPPLAAAVLSPTPIANAPAPLPPPPAELREKLVAPVPAPPAEAARAPEPAPIRVAAEPEAMAPKTVEEPKVQAAENDSLRTAHCYLKLSGRVQSNAACRVQITDNGIIFHLPGKPLEITHDHGRTWMATLGGHALGKVYKSGSCWGGHNFYACKNG